MKDAFGFTPLYRACWRNNLDVIKALLKNSKKLNVPIYNMGDKKERLATC
jgi:ankyrin repeat protein